MTAMMKIDASAAVAGTAAAVAAAPYYAEISGLIGVGLFVTVYALWDLDRMLRTQRIPFAALAFVVGCLQLIVAPWLSQYFPHWNPAYNIPEERIAEYMAYAVPLCLAFGLGMVSARPVLSEFKGFRNFRRAEAAPARRVMDRRSERQVVVLFQAAFAVMVLAPRLPVPASLQFFALLLGDLALVCPLLLYLGGRPYWWKLAVLPLIWQFLGGMGYASFHGFALWLAAYSMMFWSIEFRGHGFKALVAAGLMAFAVLQPVKTQMRSGRDDAGGSFLTRFLDFAAQPGRAFEPENLSLTLMRLNQGWIVHRVMEHVPAFEPYAGTTILRREIGGALLPRFIMPDKYVAGGKEFFEQYTGHELFAASMGLGYAGEFYAGFGRNGGIAAAYVYGLVLGMGFSLLQRAAGRNPLWWAWGPYMFLVAVKAEDTLGNALNWSVKAFLVVLLVRYAFPAIFRSAAAETLPARARAAPQPPTIG